MPTGDHPAEEQWDQYDQHIRDTSRLGMLPETRLMLASTTSFGVGAALGLSQGSTMAGLRFRAEHAHKLPTTPTGWFMYHKSKNYNMARDGLKEGVKMGFKVCVVTTAMFLIEDLYDEYRQSKDFLNTTLASLTVAGGFSLWNKFSLPMTARTTKTALLVGLIYGGLQDVAGAVRGRPIGYMNWIRRKLGAKERDDLKNTTP
ncbi:hypothetical protein N0V93_002074 [Gnomoniopsis smithogilvyi]|uniref:Uncharacterized protein n=1 Tax=Gnomoniopsis smithogilvyi TaxID=1191159 RepID=A0A9W8Z2V5_9PEZI|nr:hypothetical protein N0V93_002074 [Gnomoniopsis smithogilvyi]